MSRTTLKSQAIVIAQLEAQVAELRTQVGVLMNNLEDANQIRSRLQDERDCLTLRCDKLEEIVANSKPVSALRKPAPKPQPATAELAPVIQISDADRVFYAKFKALPREVRLAIIAFARPQFGNVGIDNIIAVRAAWHESQAAVA